MRNRMAATGLMQNPYMHAVAEALLTAGVIALPQAASGEADVDLALGVLAGIGASVPGSIIGNKAGRLAGRQIDRYMHAKPGRIDNFPSSVERVYSTGMGVMVPGSRHNVVANNAMMNSPDVPQQMKEALAPAVKIAEDRYHAFNKNLDPYLNGMESDLGMLGQRYGDNVAQLITQLAVAKALDGESEE